MKKFIILSTLLIWITLGAFAWFYVNRSTANIASTPPDYSATSTSFFSQFDENEEKANQQYLGKVIELSGIVQQVSVEDDQLSLTLEGSDMFGVSCKMSGNAKDLAEKVKKGNGIKVKGVCSGKLMDVVLVNCSLVKS